MCWFTKCSPYLKTAEKSIVVYKYLTKDLKAPIYSYQYIKNKKASEEILLIKDAKYNDFRYILQGYHSFKNIDFAKDYFAECLNYPGTYRDIRIYKCIIPKGAIYCENEFGSTVSSTIVIKRKCFNLFGFLF